MLRCRLQRRCHGPSRFASQTNWRIPRTRRLRTCGDRCSRTLYVLVFRQAAAGNCHVCAWQLPEREGEGCESGSQWPFSEHRFLQRIGYSWNEHHEGAPAGWVAKWVHLPRALAQRASHFGSSWAALLKIRDNQGSSQLGRWDTTKGPVFLLWHLSFPPWKLWVTTLHYTTHTTLH